MPRFFRLSPSGDAWLAQGDGPGYPIVHDGVVIAGRGIQPAWLDESTAIYADTQRPALHVVPLGVGDRTVLELPYTINALDARNGRWVAWAAPQAAAPTGLVRTSDGREFLGYGAPALCDNGDLFLVRDGVIFLVADGATEIKAIGGDGIGRLPRVAHGSALVAWIDDPTSGPPVIAPASRGRYGQAHYVIPILTPEGEWLVVVDADPDRLIAYPVGDPLGSVVAAGVTKEPDAIWCPSRGGIRIVASGAAGELREFVVRLTDPRRDVRIQPPAPPPPPAKRPAITIETYNPVEGDRPLAVTVRVVAEAASGPIDRVDVRARRTDGQVEASRSVDRLPADVALELVIPGVYRITATAIGPGGEGGTRKVREVTVREPAPPPPPPDTDWETFLREADLLPRDTSTRYALAWGRLRHVGQDGTGALTREQAWRFLFPDRPFPGPSPGPTPTPDWFPTRDQVRAFKGALALDQVWFSLFFLSWDEDKQDRYLARCHELGLTHVVVLFSGGYRDRFPYFNLWDDIPALRRGLTKLLRARLIPVLCAANAELAGRALTRTTPARELSAGLREGSRALGARGGEDIAAKIIAQWERTLPQVGDLLPAAIPAVEQNDFLSPDAQHRLALALARLLPDAYRLIWFTGDRCHGDHNRGTGPDGQPPAAWKPTPDENNPGKLKASVTGYWPATPAHANFYQSDKWQDVRAFVDDLGDVSVRVNGRVPVPGKTAPYPGMQRDVLYGEGPAEAILNGSTTYAATRHLAAAALAVPGITGFGD